MIISKSNRLYFDSINFNLKFIRFADLFFQQKIAIFDYVTREKVHEAESSISTSLI